LGTLAWNQFIDKIIVNKIRIVSSSIRKRNKHFLNQSESLMISNEKLVCKKKVKDVVKFEYLVDNFD
jgi:hypothetical protein